MTKTGELSEHSVAPAHLGDEILAARERFLENEMAVALLDAIPDSALVLNANRRIVAANTFFLSNLAVDEVSVLGRRPGEAIGCIHSTVSAGGCGSASACTFCGGANAVATCLDTRKRCEGECQILTLNPNRPALDLLVSAVFVPVDDIGLVLMVLRDVSSRRRRHVLERVFLHDVLNSVGGIYGLANILRDSADPHGESAFADDIYHLAGLVLDEIRSHHKLMLAEAGELKPDIATVEVKELVRDVIALYSRHDVGRGREIAVDYGNGATLMTDPVLLRRVLGNLLKNALEATPEGGKVSLIVTDDRKTVAFAIHNDGEMSAEAKSRVFHLSYSTKASTGRGLGTYSARLFCEALRGSVDFRSCRDCGTTFTVRVPSADRLVRPRK
jgi:hypothetical protein